MTRWLVTGGAGYIGAHVVEALLASGREAVVLDDLSSGSADRVPAGVPLVVGNVRDRSVVDAALADHRIDGVVHLAARKAAGESVDLPLYYYRENIVGLLTVLEAMQARGVARLVYSSSAAVYGLPEANPVLESAPLVPASPYGETKVAGEWMASGSARAWGLSCVSLRYFNVAGAGRDDLGDTSVNNLIPMVLRALTSGQVPRVFGNDYPTPDGTCVRDYVHVADLAEAHVAAAHACESGLIDEVFNVGTGRGYSVLEVMTQVARSTGIDFAPEVVARRPGDPAATFASTERIGRELGWSATRDLEQMVDSAWSAWPK